MAAGAAGHEDECAHAACAGTALLRPDAGCRSSSGLRRVSASIRPMPNGDRKHRGAAIGDEGQRHALGRDQVEIDRQIDGRLQAELDRQSARRHPREQIRLVAARRIERTQHDEGDQPDQHQAEQDAEFAGRGREDVVGMGIGQIALGDRLARPAPEPAAFKERAQAFST